MKKIINCIDEYKGVNKTTRYIDELEGIAIHRGGMDRETRVYLGTTGPEITNEFIGRGDKYPELKQVTGGQQPYTFFIGGSLKRGEHDGKIWQVAPLTDVTWHARKASYRYIGICMIGDYRNEEPTDAQWHSAVILSKVLCRWREWDPYKCIKGHGEIDGAHDGSKGPGKPAACPGDLWDMHIFRDDVARSIYNQNISALDDLNLQY